MNSPYQICVGFLFVYQKFLETVFKIVSRYKITFGGCVVRLWIYKGYFAVDKLVLNDVLNISGIKMYFLSYKENSNLNLIKVIYIFLLIPIQIIFVKYIQNWSECLLYIVCNYEKLKIILFVMKINAFEYF